jgi:hypothetical protein
MLRRIFILSLLSVLALTGCPPKKNTKEKLRTGRTSLSPTGGKNPNGTTNSYNPNNPNTLWGQISGFDQNSVYYFAQPALANAGAEEQLGQVTGIYFWGQVFTVNGQVDSQRSRIHIEVWDNKTGTARSNGGIFEQLFVTIGPEQEGFQGVQNTGQGLMFSASYMNILLVGQDNGGQYSGTVYFYNAYSGGQWNTLGQFAVQSNGFFVGGSMGNSYGYGNGYY